MRVRKSLTMIRLMMGLIKSVKIIKYSKSRTGEQEGDIRGSRANLLN